MFDLDGLSELESLTIGSYVGTMRQSDPWYSERKDGSCRIINCPNLKSIRIGRFSFADYYDSFDLTNLPSLESIQIDQRSFNNLQRFALASSVTRIVSLSRPSPTPVCESGVLYCSRWLCNHI